MEYASSRTAPIPVLIYSWEKNGTRVRSISNKRHVTSNATWSRVRGREKEIDSTLYVDLVARYTSGCFLTRLLTGDRSLRRLKGYNVFSKRTQWFLSLSLSLPRFDFHFDERKSKTIDLLSSRVGKWDYFHNVGTKRGWGCGLILERILTRVYPLKQ